MPHPFELCIAQVVEYRDYSRSSCPEPAFDHGAGQDQTLALQQNVNGVPPRKAACVLFLQRICAGTGRDTFRLGVAAAHEQEARDALSLCTVPLPATTVVSFTLEVQRKCNPHEARPSHYAD